MEQGPIRVLVVDAVSNAPTNYQLGSATRVNVEGVDYDVNFTFLSERADAADDGAAFVEELTRNEGMLCVYSLAPQIRERAEAKKEAWKNCWRARADQLTAEIERETDPATAATREYRKRRLYIRPFLEIGLDGSFDGEPPVGMGGRPTGIWALETTKPYGSDGTGLADTLRPAVERLVDRLVYRRTVDAEEPPRRGKCVLQ